MEGGGGRKRFYRALERFLLPKTAALIAVSREEVAEAQRLGYPPGRIHHIPNGIYDYRTTGLQDNQQSAVLSSCRPAVMSQAIAFFGRLTRQKGADLFLRAAAVLNIEPHIHSDIPQSEVVDKMREYSIIVVPSRWEGAPYVVLDAFAAGVPVVATRVGGLPDIIHDGVNGVLVPPDDARALSDAITTLLQNPEKRRALALAAQETLSRYTLDNMVDKIEEVYRAASRG